MPSELDDSRECMRVAREVLFRTEAELTVCLVDEMQEHLEMAGSTLVLTRDLLKEIPERASLDYAGNRREAIKELEEMGRRLKALRDKIAKLGNEP